MSGVSISLRLFFRCTAISLISVMELVKWQKLWKVRQEKSGCRRRRAALLPEQKRETGDTTAGKEELMKESEIGRKTTCPHVAPRSTGRDKIVHVSGGGFNVLSHCSFLEGKDKARC